MLAEITASRDALRALESVDGPVAFWERLLASDGADGAVVDLDGRRTERMVPDMRLSPRHRRVRDASTAGRGRRSRRSSPAAPAWPRPRTGRW